MKKPLNYYGFAFTELGEVYDDNFLASEEGKLTIEKEKKTQKKLRKQLKKNGFDASETWNLDETIARFALPRLKYFRKNLHGYPGSLKNIKEWKKILKKMIKSFEYVLEDCFDLTEEQIKEKEEGLMLFAKYYNHLWD